MEMLGHYGNQGNFHGDYEGEYEYDYEEDEDDGGYPAGDGALHTS